MANATLEMSSVVKDSAAPGGFRLGSAPRPTPAANEALIRVAEVSLNYGEIKNALNGPDGSHPGWDYAGVVVEPAADGSGPHMGARVAGFVFSGAWSDYVVGTEAMLAVVPDGVSLADASALPAAALTARGALEKGPARYGRKVLVTGASGGVGNFAVQLGRCQGDVVTAAVRNPGHEALMRELGAAHVVVSEHLAGAEAHGPYDLIVENVGGATLQAAFGLVAPGGILASVGIAGGEASCLFERRKMAAGAGFYNIGMAYEWQLEPLSVGLAEVLDKLASGRLRVVTGRRGAIADIGGIADDYMQRRFAGKAVLTVSDTNA